MLDFPRVSRMVGNVAIAIGLLEMIVALGFLVHAQSWHAGTVGTAGTVVAHERSTRATAGRGVSRPTYAEVVRFLDASGVQHEFRRHNQIGKGLIWKAVTTAHGWGCERFLATVQIQNVRFFQRLHWRSIEELEIRGIRHHRMEADLTYYVPARERRPALQAA